jgi:hypothetical protein
MTSVTYSSQLLFSVMTQLNFDDERESESARSVKAKALFDAADAYVQGSHRFAARKIAPADGSIDYYTDGSEHSGTSLWLWQNRYVIMVSCTDENLGALSWKEGMSDIKHPKPQPPPIAPPKLPLPPRFSENACTRPKARDAHVAAFLKTQAAMTNYAGAVASYLSRLEDFKAAQFAAKGAWTDADKSRFAQSLLDDPQLAAETRHGFSLLKAYNDVLGTFDGARKAHDPVRACKASVAANAAGHDLAASSEAQALRILALYGAEAVRRGITLE